MECIKPTIVNICNIGKESDFEKEMYKAEKMHYAKT